MEDKLDHIFKLQKKFDDDLISRRNLEHISWDEWIQRETLAIISELAELLEEVQFKWWKDKKDIQVEKVKEELVDILHFFASMCIKSGISADDLYMAYCEKNKENFNRQDGLTSREGYESKAK